MKGDAAERRAELKKRHERLPDSIAAVDEHVQRITAAAYDTVTLISNQVLSRNPMTNALLHHVWSSTRPVADTGQTFVRVAVYYVRSLRDWLGYVIVCGAEWWRPAGRHRPVGEAPTCVIDTYVATDSLLARGGRYEDEFFPGMAATLRKYGRRPVIVPRLLDRLNNPRRVGQIVAALRDAGETFVTEFDLLRGSDLLRALWFVLRYPMDVLRLARRLEKGDDIDRLVSFELRNTIGAVTFPSYVRYLVGRRLGEQAGTPLQVMSWAENQVLDKNFYRGLRETAPQCTILGCQPFVFSPTYINGRTADAEREQRVTPDVVLVNGLAYLRDGCRIPHRLGPSFRYGWIWSSPIEWARKTETAVFLSYDDRLNQDLIRIVGGSEALKERPIAVRLHPVTPTRRKLPLAPCWRYSKEAKADLIAAAAIVVTTESGVALEAAACGSSVVVVGSQTTCTSNPMLELGRGQIWELVFDSDEFDTAYGRLRTYRECHRDEILSLACEYRRTCFVQPTEECIAKALEVA